MDIGDLNAGELDGQASLILSTEYVLYSEMLLQPGTFSAYPTWCVRLRETGCIPEQRPKLSIMKSPSGRLAMQPYHEAAM